jgi:hypothetical protein
MYVMICHQVHTTDHTHAPTNTNKETYLQPTGSFTVPLFVHCLTVRPLRRGTCTAAAHDYIRRPDLR